MADKGISHPVEGTILTVIKDASSASQMQVADGNNDLLSVMEAVVSAANESVANTPTLLPVLREAGVVDAGGQGLYTILEGALHHLRGEIAGARGRAVIRLDGFISADAAYTGGELTTKPLVFEGTRLQLNMATGSGGSVRVEIQDENGKPLQGYSAEDACELSGNYIRTLASWRAQAVPNMGRTRQPVGDTNVGPLAGRPVKLRFVMRDAKLYSFQFRP